MHSETSWSTGSCCPYANVTWSTSTVPERGRSIAAWRWRTVGRVSSTPKILARAAADDWTVLYSWLSWLIGSNRLLSHNTNAATVPTVTIPRVVSQPPYPMITAVPATPAYSMIGKYLAEIRTVCMFAWYWSSFVRLNFCANASSRPNAWTTRTPSRLSCSVLRFVEMVSRTSRYALFDTRRNHRLPK